MVVAGGGGGREGMLDTFDNQHLIHEIRERIGQLRWSKQEWDELVERTNYDQLVVQGEAELEKQRAIDLAVAAALQAQAQAKAMPSLPLTAAERTRNAKTKVKVESRKIMWF